MKPDKAHVHDMKWADELINTLPKELQLKVCFAYCDAYQEAYDAEPTEHRKEGKGRVEANTRLRAFVAKHTKAMAKKWSFTQ